MTVPKLIFQIYMPVKRNQCAFSIQLSHKRGYTYLRRYAYQHMYMVWHYNLISLKIESFTTMPTTTESLFIHTIRVTSDEDCLEQFSADTFQNIGQIKGS